MSNLPVSSSPKAKKLPDNFLTLTVILSAITAAFGGWAVIATAEAYKLKGVAIAADVAWLETAKAEKKPISLPRYRPAIYQVVT